MAEDKEFQLPSLVKVETKEGKIPLLDKPVICLLLDPQPVKPYAQDGIMSPQEIALRARLNPAFIPLLITDQSIESWAFENVELFDYFGPFKVYRPLGNVLASGFIPTPTYKDRQTFLDQRKNLAGWCYIPEMDLPLISETQDLDKEIKDEEKEEKKVKLHPTEARILRDQLSQIFDEEVTKKIEETEKISDFPSALRDGLTEITNRLATIGTHSTLKDFSEKNIEPLKSFAAKEVLRLGKLGNDHADDVFESIVGLEGFDSVLEMLKSQSKLLVGVERKLNHNGIVIPFEKFTGLPSYSPNTSLSIEQDTIVIKHKGKEYKFPLPEKNDSYEICFKGGIARTLAKIALGEDISGELPVHDVDIVIFGKNNPPIKEVAEKYKTNARDIEKTEEGTTYQKYCATRDSSFNEVLVNSKGIFISFNCLSSMYQGLSQAADDNTNESLFNKHIFTVYKPDIVTGKNEGTEQFVYAGKERFPSPVALSRMFKLLIDGKCEGIVVPQGIRKTDVGIYWFVIARKILGEENNEIKQAKLDRMLTLAKFVKSPFFEKLPKNQKDNPQTFLDLLKNTYPNFDMEGNLSDKDTILWVIQKLKNQILRAYSSSVGQSGQKEIQQKITSEDLSLNVITLPPMEAYGITDQKREDVSLQERIKLQKTREIIDIFEKFSTLPDQNLKEIENDIRNTIIMSYKDTNLSGEDLGNMYYIPKEKRGDFLEAMKNAGYFAGTDASGVSWSVFEVKLSCIFVDKNEDLITQRFYLFEELYHASGLKIAGKRGARTGYSTSRFTKEGKKPPTTLLEEGMAGLEAKYYKDFLIFSNTNEGKQLENGLNYARFNQTVDRNNNIETPQGKISADFVHFIPNPKAFGGLVYFTSPSYHAGEVLNNIVEKCGKEEMVNLLRSARRGDIEAMREVAKRVDLKFGQGSYGLLIKASANDIAAVINLKRLFSS